MVPESITDPCDGYGDHPFLKTIQMKKTTRRSENELVDRVCLSRWSSCRSSDARRFRSVPRSAQDDSRVLGRSCSSCLALRQEGSVAHPHRATGWAGSHAACSAETPTATTLQKPPCRQEHPLPCSSVTLMFFHLRNMSQGASTLYCRCEIRVLPDARERPAGH
jgi:hypothetical protein